MKNLSANISRILATTLLMFLLIGVQQGLYTYDDFKFREEKYVEHVKDMRELQWQAIESVITYNYSNAESFGDGIKNNIEEKVLAVYLDKSKLQFDLDNPSSDAEVYEIFSKEIKGKYLNDIRNDNNDPFIASRNGVLSDLSLNCSPNGTVFRTWESEIAGHYNKSLGTKAVNAITYQVNKPIFWEYNESTVPNHIIISEMDIKELKNVFLKEGLEGLESYEFLKPVYIQRQSDIFGTPDVDNIGVRSAKNSKIIVVSGFNIVDILNKYHKHTLLKYDSVMDKIEENNKIITQRTKIMNASICIILLFCIIFTAIINNYVVTIVTKAGPCLKSEKQ